ncbi:MAG: tryptophan--tRNA ligase [Bacteroidaceae bacterium]|nr:tryptophan--tRNA ligase [Bacteroidaceae bacterium]
MSKPIVLSGIRATGHLHLGNYFGALRNFVEMQQDYDCRYFIADYHSLTTKPDPTALNDNVRSILAEYLAAGMDPEKCMVYVQSDVPETCEFFTLLNMHAYLGELEKTVAFKDKARQQPNNVNAGLLTYPVLMAADILQHKANFVPVGKDQLQHLEMARNFANRFNHFYGVDFLVEPHPYVAKGEPVKVPGLDGSGKMGKSEGNCIYINDDDATVIKKFKKAVTSLTPEEPNSPLTEPVENLFTFLRLVSEPDVQQFYLDAWNNCSIRYGDLKKQIAEDVLKVTRPIRERYNEIYADTEYLNRVRREGAEKVREIVKKSTDEMRRIMGIKMFE